MPTPTFPRPRFVLLFALLTVGGCASAEPVYDFDGAEPGGLLITRTEIEASGAHDAMEVVERARSHLTIQRTRGGSPVRITHRGVDSFLLAPDVLVVVDGTRVSHAVRHLEAIPARSILWVQILSSREAAMRWGTSGGNGVIMVATTARR